MSSKAEQTLKTKANAAIGPNTSDGSTNRKFSANSAQNFR